MAEIEQILSSKSSLERAITLQEAKVTGAERKYYLAQAKALGHFLMTGKNKSKNLMFNAHTIAHLANTKRLGNISATEADAQAEVLNPLITLYALREDKGGFKASAAEVLRAEINRPDGKNGFEVMIKMHAQLQIKAKQAIFDGSPIHMMKGYTKETFNPHTEIIAATEAEGKQLELAGYKKVYDEALPRDPADPTGPARHLYVIKGQGIARHVSGFLSNTGRQSRGYAVRPDLGDVEAAEFNAESNRFQKHIRARKEQEIEDMFDTPESWSPAADKNPNFMAPVLNYKGEASDYRYLMEEDTKDDVLKRNNQIDRVMGNIAGSILDKEVSPGLNNQAIDAMKSEYDNNYLENQEAYLEVSENSADPAIAERYRLLPDDVKKHIKKVWGSSSMIVRKDVYQMAFAYRKFSLGDMFNKEKDEQNYLEQVLTWVLGQIEVEGPDGRKTLIGSAKARWLVRSENAWLSRTCLPC